MRLPAVLIVLALVARFDATDSQKYPAPTILDASVDSVQVPPFPFIGGPECDADGYMYFHLDNGNYMSTDILRLSPDGKDGTRFAVPSDMASKIRFDSFSVSPQGELVVSAFSDKGVPLLVSFDDDGGMNNPVTLELPKGVFSNSIVAFNGGAVFFSGYYGEPPQKSTRGRSYLAIFDPSGGLRVELRSISLPKYDGLSGLPDGAGAVSEDGNLYFVLPNEIVVISQQGKVVRRIAFKKPHPRQRAISVRVSSGAVAITLARPQSEISDSLEMSYLVLDTFSGSRFGYYMRPEQLHFAADVCFSRQEGFTFLGSDKSGQTKLIRAPLY